MTGEIMDAITVDYCRTLHPSQLAAIAHPIASEQLRLREQGNDLIRGVLRTLIGHSFSGTSGWHVLAFAADDGYLGFVNTAFGHAVKTDVQLSPELIEALTVPLQKAGPQASGAAVWTAPDAGEAQRSEAPAGWMQLVLDLRGEAAAISCKAHVCAWGLRTCYSERHDDPQSPGTRVMPGAPGLDQRNPDKLPEPEAWRISEDAETRMLAAAEPIMQRIVCAVAAIEGLQERMQDALASGGMAAAHDLAFRHAGRHVPGFRDTYGALAALRDSTNSVTNRVIQKAMRDAGITRILAIGGDLARTGPYDYFRMIAYILESALLRILAPVAEATFTAHAPLVRTDRDDTHAVHSVTQHIMREMAAHTLELLLTDVVRASDETTILDALYSEGYLRVHVPLALPESE